MVFDCVIIGGGPAAVSAALTLRQRNKTALIVSGEINDIPLSRSEKISNYPGMPETSGRDMLETMEAQAIAAGAELFRGRATTILPMGETFGISVGSDFCEGRTVILCTGVTTGRTFPGEQELLGRGVSYCVTCDGMLYRNRRTCVVGFTSDAEEEAELLRSMGCQVQLFTSRKDKYAIEGEERVTALRVNDTAFPCDGVFILRPAAAPDTLLPGLAMNVPHIAVDRDMAAGVPGVFAAGDCTGGPYQIAKAVGEGCIAALSAARYMEKRS